jgi:ABC-type nitrate/sulfonate/bicarbonate transport system ATPase subunit
MGHVLIEGLYKYFVERRKARRVENSDPDIDRGEALLVLRDINLELQDGEMVCVLGPSGCGKTTLARIIAGFDKPSSGVLLVDGKPVVGPGAESIFVFQHNGLLPWFTVWENVALGVRHIKDKDEMASRIQDHIEMVNLEGFEDSYPHQLSGGMQRRAELARALVVNPEVMFMDEPFAGLDFLTRLKMREEIVNMHEFFQKTIIFITHDIEEALIMADRVVVFSDRPASVEMNIELAFPHPRDFHRDAELEDIRRQVYMQLGVHYAL